MRKYNSLSGDKLLFKLDKVPPGGLGLSLAGNKERGGKTSVFVVGVRSTCPLPIEVGDELLEVMNDFYEFFGSHISHIIFTNTVKNWHFKK